MHDCPDWPRTPPGPCGSQICAMQPQFSNCTGTVRTTTTTTTRKTTMMLTVSILPLVVLLSERAPRAFCGPTADGNLGVAANGTTGGVWVRPFGVLAEEDDHAFYTLEDGSPRVTTIKPRVRSPRRSSKLRREPRFISFETNDNTIEVELNFAIPFVSVPIQKSMNGVMSSVLKGTPLLNINLGAVALAGVMTAGGALIGAAARTFSNSSLLSSWNLPLTRDQRSESRHKQVERDDQSHEASLVWTLLGSLDRTMERYDIDAVACAQRTVCWYVKEATVAVGEGRAGPFDTIVEGLSRADWMGRFTVGTALEPAIRAGRKQGICEQTFPDCAIKNFVERVVRSVRKR